jgi:hypothetical protein
MVTKKVVRGEGVPVSRFSSVPVGDEGLGVEILVTLREGEEVGDPVVRFSSVPVEVGLEEEVETEASEKEIASLSREMILPGIVAIT